MNTYHNTTDEAGATLRRYKRKAGTQKERIAQLFAIRQDWASLLSPSAVHNYLFSSKVPLTSIRRAMSDLAQSGYLTRTGMLVDGPYGRREHLWRLTERKPKT